MPRQFKIKRDGAVEDLPSADDGGLMVTFTVLITKQQAPKLEAAIDALLATLGPGARVFTDEEAADD